MKLTKARLQQNIKEEIGAIEGCPGPDVYIISEPSVTYGGKDVEIKLLGVYLDRSADEAALENFRNTGPGRSAEMFAMPANKISRYGYTD